MTYIPDKQAFQTPQQLYQGELTNSATSVFSPAANEQVFITSIYITSTVNQTRWFTLWHDEDGTTYDDTTVVCSEIDVDGGATEILTDPIYMNNSSGNLAFEGEVNNALTISIYGIITDLS